MMNSLLNNQRVLLTQSGVLVKSEQGLGLLTYSPFTSQIYAVHPTEAQEVLNWLSAPESQPPMEIYAKTLGPGWAAPLDEAKFPSPHLLPEVKMWSSLPMPRQPLVINWLITGRCPLACRYCYAEDLMRDDSREPRKEDISRIGESILSLNPLVVVLTGGDPLFSPHLEEAMQCLSGQAGIVVDTSGYTFTSKHIALFKKHRVAVRISFDSERPKINQYQRPLHPPYAKRETKNVPTAQAAIAALCMCLDAGIPVTVQTVATQKTANDLVALGDKLFRLGVRSWRIFKVAPSAARYDGYKELVGSVGKTKSGKRSDGPYKYVFQKVQEAYSNTWQQKMAVQVTYNETPNAVILVGPDGVFYSESNVMLGKTILDEVNPTMPSLDSICSKVNMTAHAERYLNVTKP